MALNENRDPDPSDFRKFQENEREKNDFRDTPVDKSSQDPENDDDLEFVVTEAHQDSPELVGMDKQPSIDDDLGLQSTADMMNNQAHTDPPPGDDHRKPPDPDFSPIGESAPPPPQVQDSAYEPPEPLDTEPPARGAADPDEFHTGDRLARLSEQEVNAINEELYGERSYLSEEEKRNLVQSLEGVPETKRPQGEPPPVESQKAAGSEVQTPRVENRKPDVPEVETPGFESHTAEITAAQTPRVETHRTDQPQIETKLTEDRKPNVPEVESPDVESHKAEVPVAQTPRVETHKAEQPEVKTPQAEYHKPEVPQVEIPRATNPEVVPSASQALEDADTQDVVVRHSTAKKEAPEPDAEPKSVRFEEQPTGKPFGNTPIEPPKKPRSAPVDPSKVDIEPGPGRPKPAMARRQRGVAHFYRNFIQVQGAQQFHDGDELIVNEREYVLKPKTLSPKTILTVAAPVLVILLVIVGLQFVSFGDSGEGKIVGMALDEYNQPYLGGAEINLPELGKTVASNAQGFFSIEDLPAGPHQIDYIVAGEVIGSDYATVVGDELTTVTLKPSPNLSRPESEGGSKDRAAAERPSEPAQMASSKNQRQSDQSGNRQNHENASQSSKTNARLALKANVEGATLKLDNKVIGAGNLTYTKLSPGKHSYEVSKLGFESASGSITLRGDQTRTLAVELTPASQAAREEVFSARDFLESGLEYLRSGEIKSATADFTSAINKDPSLAEAYFARAQAYQVTSQTDPAVSDYLRAAEIFQIGKDYNQSVTSYTKAIELDQTQLALYLGRGNVYLAKGEEIAAIADFEEARDIDGDNAQPRIGLGRARFEQGYYKKAAKEFKEARERDPKNPIIHQYLMLSYMAANDTKNVKKSYEKFQKVATQDQLEQLRNDQRFVAIMRIIDADS